MVNSFVEYLTRFYTGGAAHARVFDEYNLEDRQFEAVLHVQTDVEARVMALYDRQVPPNVLLTGNAGDGKTRLARAVIEKLSGQPLSGWGDGAEPYDVPMSAYTLRVIKDLSDYARDRAQLMLAEMAAAPDPSDKPRVYLVAANEGKLRDSLPADLSVRDAVNEQLANGPNEDSALILYNLNLERNSQYVGPLLSAMTHPSLWSECSSCPSKEQCPILFNQQRLSLAGVQARIATLYKVVEQTGVHITMRDMLIHLTHTLIGATNCSQSGAGSVSEPWRDVYYQNCWASRQPEEYRRVLNVVYHLDRLEIGMRSQFDIDSFILHGGETEAEQQRHQHLFGKTLDMGNGIFQRDRDTYLEGQASEDSEDKCAVLDWLPHCRRKLFFEWESSLAEQLIALQTVPVFRGYLEAGDSWDLNNGALPLLLAGLNRALIGFFLTGDNINRELLVTSQFRGSAASTAVPIIKFTIPARDIELVTFPETNPDRLRLKFLRAPNVYLEVDQLLFEHLIRLAEGGTHNILADECSLRLQNFRDQLLGNQTAFQPKPETRTLEFFATINGQHVQLKLMVQDGKVKVQ